MAGRAGKGRILRKDDSCVRLWSSMHEIFIYAQAPCAHRQSPPVVKLTHTRRIKTEEKAKVVSSVWGRQNLFNSSSHYCSCFAWDDFEWKDELHQDGMEEKDEFILLSKIVPDKIPSAARNWIKYSPPQTEATTFTFSSVLFLLLCADLITVHQLWCVVVEWIPTSGGGVGNNTFANG